MAEGAVALEVAFAMKIIMGLIALPTYLLTAYSGL